MNKERPILFKSEMINAILEGRKSQTRRIVKPQPKVIHAIYTDASVETNCIFRRGDQRIHCSYGQVGDLLWVKKNYFTKKKDAVCWLEITNIRVERLRDITLQDVFAEGAILSTEKGNFRDFKNLWDSLNAKRGYPWESNPFVWVIEFKRIKR
jgi:hypothetical protein